MKIEVTWELVDYLLEVADEADIPTHLSEGEHKVNLVTLITQKTHELWAFWSFVVGCQNVVYLFQ
jgi:hypothetical protein